MGDTNKTFNFRGRVFSERVETPCGTFTKAHYSAATAYLQLPDANPRMGVAVVAGELPFYGRVVRVTPLPGNDANNNPNLTLTLNGHEIDSDSPYYAIIV